MLKIITAVVFIVLAVLMLHGFITHLKEKKRWMYLSFSLLGAIIAIVLFLC